MDGLVLLAKQPGLTSFSSLFNVKKALNTTKVGHTGTLDSFAQGLLVVCTGKLTHLTGNIIEFDKSYSAVIEFGYETDTLEYTGNVVKTSDLPELENLKKSIEKYKGPLMQYPPQFSAIHVNGKRASDLMREGVSVKIEPRNITVYNSNLVEYKLNDEGKVLACRIDFVVSKGTYIRSLARDIGLDAGSLGTLSGLYRTKVGNFKVEDAAGFTLLKEFNIENALKEKQKYFEELSLSKNPAVKSEKTPYVETEEDALIKKEILESIYPFSEDCAKLCGFEILHLKKEYEFSFKNGKPVLYQMFEEYTKDFTPGTKFAVFSEGIFTGLVQKTDLKHLNYVFVII